MEASTAKTIFLRRGFERQQACRCDRPQDAGRVAFACGFFATPAATESADTRRAMEGCGDEPDGADHQLACAAPEGPPRHRRERAMLCSESG
jgi:hypothetical protein